MYNNLNRTIQDAAWNNPRLFPWELFVALDDEYAQSLDLPHSMRWPWDHSKGVYIPTAAHEMHCIFAIRSFINGKQDGLADADLPFDYSHTIHCVNALRESIMCNANDLPMYTGRLHANQHHKNQIAGRGTIRMCRDWDALMSWTHEHSACYSSLHRNDPGVIEVDLYKYCPDHSRPWEDRSMS